MISYKDALDVAQITLITRGYPAMREVGGGGLEYLTADVSRLYFGKTCKIEVVNYAEFAIQLVADFDSEYEREPWSPYFEFPWVEDEETGEFFYTAIAKTVHEFLDEIEAL